MASIAVSTALSVPDLTRASGRLAEISHRSSRKRERQGSKALG